MIRRVAGVLLAGILMCSAAVMGGCGNDSAGNPDKVKLDPENPVTISVWNYYNGEQQDAFNGLVDEFNSTEGRERGIFVETYSLGSVGELEQSVLDAADGKVGASQVPNIFAAYADTAYAVDQRDLVADLMPYFSEKELDRFIASYLNEGEFSGAGTLKIFPVAKSTEILVLNKTDWDKFAEATGWKLSELSTIEGVTRTAEAYYRWTDSLTAEKNDGKAFFGRDAMANYLLLGARQLGTEIFTVKEDGSVELHFDRDVMKKLWDNYYVPFINGYFDASARFRSGDMKTGSIISFVGASSGATFFPSSVVGGDDDQDEYPIELLALECPKFEGGEAYAVQQGAGMVVTKSEPEKVYASVQFLKWFTQDERNIRFSVASGYLPVTKAANDAELITEYIGSDGSMMDSILQVSVDTVMKNKLYTPKAFKNGTTARNVLETSLSGQAAADRKLVRQRIEQGMTLEEASALYLQDDNFDRWYEKTKTELEAAIGSDGGGGIQ
ncbi:extracellular solute-binding protein [Bacilliculturomica massiliensis]|uniref:extracellular solute-binding protein n=1 Tax=Bacilliculturomica massiliensis TaxID=1917867 RepID=UPI001A92DD2E|nr:extracellular solute-binding protein [Bacilliculturomica massiliensis]